MAVFADSIAIIGIGLEILGFIWLIKHQKEPEEIDYHHWRRKFIKNKLRNEKWLKKHGLRYPTIWKPDDLRTFGGISYIEMNMREQPFEGIPKIYKEEKPIFFYRFWQGRKNNAIKFVIMGLFLQIIQMVLPHLGF